MAATVRAQYDVSFAHYWAMEPSFNPAAVGKEAKLNVTGAYALQMAGFEHNPKTMYAAADMQLYGLGTYHGIGVQLLNDDIGLFSHKRLAVQYAYQRRVVKGKLSVGVQLGMLGETFDGSKAEMPEDGSDPILSSSSINGSGLDVSAGIYYLGRVVAGEVSAGPAAELAAAPGVGEQGLLVVLHRRHGSAAAYDHVPGELLGSLEARVHGLDVVDGAAYVLGRDLQHEVEIRLEQHVLRLHQTLPHSP